MPTDPSFYAVGLTAVFVIAFGRGAFGGGLAILGVPVMALVVDPIAATVMMALIVSASDPLGIVTYRPRTWSWRDLAWLMPGMAIGLCLGAVFFVSVDPRLVALGIAIVTLWFTARWFLHERRAVPSNAPVQPLKAIVCAAASGFTTFIAHGGNPPIAYYLLPRGLPKSVYTGTMIGLFLPSNTVKLVLYVVMGAFTREIFLMALALLPAVPLGFWAGKRLHERLDEHRLYFVLYALLAVTGLKLLVDSVRALLA